MRTPSTLKAASARAQVPRKARRARESRHVVARWDGRQKSERAQAGEDSEAKAERTGQRGGSPRQHRLLNEAERRESGSTRPRRKGGACLVHRQGLQTGRHNPTSVLIHGPRIARRSMEKYPKMARHANALNRSHPRIDQMKLNIERRGVVRKASGGIDLLRTDLGPQRRGGDVEGDKAPSTTHGC